MTTADRADVARTTWSDIVEAVVLDIRRTFGEPVAKGVAAVLTGYYAEVDATLRRDFADTERNLDEMTRALGDIDERIADLLADASRRQEKAEALQRTAESDRQGAARLLEEAANLHRAAAEARSEAEEEAERVRDSLTTLRNRIDDLNAPADAREAELIAWEAELTARAAAIPEPERAPGTAPVLGPPRGGRRDVAAESQRLRSQWRNVGASGDGRPRGWRRGDRSDDRTGSGSR